VEMSLEVLARYLVGCPDVSEKERRFLRTFLERKPTPKALIKEITQKLPTIYPALSTIAKELEQEVFSLDVITSYFIGTPCLSHEIAREILERMNLPREAIENLPSWVRPVHNHIVFILSQPLFQEDILNACFVRPGEVVEVFEKVAKVKTILLKKENDRFFLRENVFEYPRHFCPIKEGDRIAIHFGVITQTLTEAQVVILTFDLLSIINHLNQ